MRTPSSTHLPERSTARFRLQPHAKSAHSCIAAVISLLTLVPAAVAQQLGTTSPGTGFTTTQSKPAYSAIEKTAEEIDIGPTVSLAAPSSGSMTELTEPDGTTVILPPGYDPEMSYPALVLMPYTNRTALHMFNWGIYDAYQQRTNNTFVMIMPPGQGSSANWSGYGWESFVNEYEAYIQQDLGPIAAKYNIDPNQLVVGGFSLGGDLSWALSLRNPDIFSGAIVMGSMSTYRDAENARLLADRGFRYFMVMGGYDGNRGSMYNALDSLDQHAVTYHYEEVGNAGHGDLPEQMQSDLFLTAMDYVLAGVAE